MTFILDLALWIVTFWLMSRVYQDMLSPRLRASLGYDNYPLLLGPDE